MFFFNDYIDQKFIKFFICLSFIIKVILIFSPDTGTNVKQYFNKKDIENENFVKSYDTFWNKNITILQKRSWLSKKEFPLDWKDYGGKKFYEKNIHKELKIKKTLIN